MNIDIDNEVADSEVTDSMVNKEEATSSSEILAQEDSQHGEVPTNGVEAEVSVEEVKTKEVQEEVQEDTTSVSDAAGSDEKVKASSGSSTYEVDIPIDPALTLAAKKPKEEEVKEKQESQEEEEEKEEPLLKELPPERANLPWYVVHTYSGFEALVKANLEEKIKQESMEDLFGNIVVPQEKVVELVRGEKKTSKRKFFPGYILVQ